MTDVWEKQVYQTNKLNHKLQVYARVCKESKKEKELEEKTSWYSNI